MTSTVVTRSLTDHSVPLVSVVMAVFNGAGKLSPTIESVLNQEEVNLEIIIVNDGSTDDTKNILERFENADSRIQALDQENHGLTQSLVRGCAEAKGDFIARIDAGDTYLPGKLLKQLEAFQKNPNLIMVSCGTRFVGPEGEFLFDVIQTQEQARKGLDSLDIKTIQGPSSHPSVMFKRRDYEKVGGYRSAFLVAQDLDLWLRLVELGDLMTLSEVLLQAEITPDSITGTSRAMQLQLSEILIECTKNRRNGVEEAHLLEKAARLKRGSKRWSRLGLAKSNYFIARSLQINSDPRCVNYFTASIKAFPLYLKSLVMLVVAFVLLRVDWHHVAGKKN